MPLHFIDQAMAQLQLAHRRPLPQLSFLRGDTLARLGRNDEAEQAFLNEIHLFPDEPQAYQSLILLYAKEGRPQKATGLLFSFEKAAPTVPSYVAISETLKAIGDASDSRFWAERGLRRYPTDRRLKALARG
jgi:tetratricopeptide (TPR) repeat protein